MCKKAYGMYSEWKSEHVAPKSRTLHKVWLWVLRQGGVAAERKGSQSAFV
jgi:hypothetical protein